MHTNRYGKISSWESVTALKKVPIIECGESLVDFLELCPRLFWDKPRWKYERVQLLRESAAERLCRAAEALPQGYRLAVIEGWRPPHIQRRMNQGAMKRIREQNPDWSASQVKRIANRFTAPPSDRVPPPHSTGGAVDVVLADETGAMLDHTSPYETRNRSAYPFDARRLSDEAREHRQILKEAMESAGLTNYPSEFWHYSYGDQGWAYRGGHAHALYGPTEPPGYSPPPGEITDEPLEWAGE